MGAVWGGVSFIYLTIGIFALITLLLNKTNNKKLYIYSIWLFSSFITLNSLSPLRFDIGTLVTSLTTSIALFVFLLFLINYLIFDRKIIKININLPNIIISFIITLVVTIIFLFIEQGPNFLVSKISDLYIHLVKEFTTNRWVITVAESQQPYIQDWFGQFSKSYIWLIIIGSIILFYEIIKIVSKKDAWKLTGIYALFIFGFIFSKYSPSSIFNGQSSLSVTVYIGSLILLILVLIYY